MTEERFKTGRITIDLEWDFPIETTDKQIKDFLADVELPNEYVEDSFEFISINKITRYGEYND